MTRANFPFRIEEVTAMETLNKASRTIYQWDYDRELVTQFKRVGKCSKCGSCCRGFLEIQVAHRYDPDIPQEGGQATTGQGIWIEIMHQEQRTFFKLGNYQSLDRKCAFLATNNQCGSYTKRPLFCREFPLSPQNIDTFPECTYNFMKNGEWTFSQLKKKPTQSEERMAKYE
jgi:Fe-S-cluster containining protein